MAKRLVTVAFHGETQRVVDFLIAEWERSTGCTISKFGRFSYSYGNVVQEVHFWENDDG